MMELKNLFTPVGSMDAEEAKAFMAERRDGEYTLLDVRQPGEYEDEHLPGAKLMPLPELSDTYKKLDPEKPTIMARSSASGAVCRWAWLIARNFSALKPPSRVFGRMDDSKVARSWPPGATWPYTSKSRC